MKNKQGLIFGLYLVFLTLFMIGTMMVLYLKQQENVNAYLVPPTKVLEVRDKLETFEIKEGQIAKAIFDKMDLTSSTLENDFRNEFIDEIFSDSSIKDFFYEDLFLDGREIDTDTLDYKSFLENRVYKKEDFSFVSTSMSIKRSTVGKRIDLKVLNLGKDINFPVVFYFDFERSFKVSFGGIS